MMGKVVEGLLCLISILDYQLFVWKPMGPTHHKRKLQNLLKQEQLIFL